MNKTCCLDFSIFKEVIDISLNFEREGVMLSLSRVCHKNHLLKKKQIPYLPLSKMPCVGIRAIGSVLDHIKSSEQQYTFCP